MKLAASYFRVYRDSMTEYISSVDPPLPKEAKPFVVRIEGRHVIPCNVLVFARDVKHARSRAMGALRDCAEMDYRGPTARPFVILERLKSGEYEMKVETFDIALMPGIQWATNDGL